MSGMVAIPAHDVTLAQTAVAAAREVPGVAGISRGRYAIARTFGLGGWVVDGIQLTPQPEGLHMEVHVVVQPVPLLLLCALAGFPTDGAAC